MTEKMKCSSCGNEIERDVSFHQCPRCLLNLGLWRGTEGSADGALWDAGSEGERKLGLVDYWNELDAAGWALSIRPANSPWTGSWPSK